MTGVPKIADLDWRALAQPLARAEDALARLDERLAKSPIRDGWIARTCRSRDPVEGEPACSASANAEIDISVHS
jgi:hypothetical protein